MKITLKTERCDGAGGCEFACPQLFFINDDRVVEALTDTPDPSLYDCARRAASVCPHRVIRIDEGVH